MKQDTSTCTDLLPLGKFDYSNLVQLGLCFLKLSKKVDWEYVSTSLDI